MLVYGVRVLDFSYTDWLMRGGASFESYYVLLPGIYRVEMHRGRLDAATLDCYYFENGERHYVGMKELSVAEDRAVFYIDAGEGIPSLEIFVGNSSKLEIKPDELNTECLTQQVCFE